MALYSEADAAFSLINNANESVKHNQTRRRTFYVIGLQHHAALRYRKDSAAYIARTIAVHAYSRIGPISATFKSLGINGYALLRAKVPNLSFKPKIVEN